MPRPLGGGLYVWVALTPAMQAIDLAADAAREDIFIAPSAAFSTTEVAAPGMRVNVAHGADPRFLAWLGRFRA